MPFDGREFSREACGASGSWGRIEAAGGPGRSLLAWLRGLLPGGPGEHDARSPSPKRPGAAGVTAVHLLAAARALIETEGAWGQGTYQAPGGQRCAMGALRAAARAAGAGWHRSDAKTQAHDLLLAVVRERGFAGVELMNDGSDHAQVLAAFDAALRRAARR